VKTSRNATNVDGSAFLLMGSPMNGQVDNLSNALRAGVEILLTDSNGGKNWVAPHQGKYPIGHTETFLNRYTSMARVYRDYDESIIDSRDNARFMWNDVGIRECIDSRMRSVSLLNWHLEPEDELSPDQAAFCTFLEKVIRKIRYFTKYRQSMQLAIWLGKQGMNHRWRSDMVGGTAVWKPTGIHQDDFGWRPIHGDKLVFRMDRPIGVPGAYAGQLGVRVGAWGHKAGDVINDRWRLESTDYGLAYFLSPAERRLLAVHRHNIEDAAYEDGVRAGVINGTGIRSVVYWEWVQSKEAMAFMVEFVERMAGGVQIWKYPQGNQQALAEAKAAAENYNSGQEHIMLVPVPIGENGSQYGVDVVEPGFQGVETLQHLIKDYFGDRIKRYILGQKLSSEAEATGMGSGVAELHLDTLLQILRSDATAHEECLTSELVETLIKINVQKKAFMHPGFIPRFVVETEEPDVDKKLEGCVTAAKELGLKFRKKDIYELVGMAMPGPGDDVTEPLSAGGAGPGGENPPGQEEQQPVDVAPPSESKEPKDGTDSKEDDTARDDNGGHGVSKSSLQRYAKTILHRYGGLKRT